MLTWANIMPFEMYTRDSLKIKNQIKLIVCVMKS